jgi:flagellin
MAITVNTNIASLVAQKSLNAATTKMNTAMERMSTGLRINSSKDDAAGMAVSTKLDYQVSSLAVAQDNGQMGASMLDTTEGVLGVIGDNLQRIRDLTEQAANGTYGTDALVAIKTEVGARLDEITRSASSSEFNGKKILSGDISKNITLQVGIDSDNTHQISLDKAIFADATATGVFGQAVDVESAFADDASARAFLDEVDDALKNVTDRTTKIGGYQSAITSAIDSANVMATNLTSSSSMIKDADIAEESSNYIKNQILQQASATLLATANQAPSIALNLV